MPHLSDSRAIGAGILFVRREELSLLRLVPSTLLAFLAWTLASAIWSTDKAQTLRGWAAILGFALLAVTIGHVRDTLQTVRALINGATKRVRVCTRCLRSNKVTKAA